MPLTLTFALAALFPASLQEPPDPPPEAEAEAEAGEPAPVVNDGGPTLDGRLEELERRLAAWRDAAAAGAQAVKHPDPQGKGGARGGQSKRDDQEDANEIVHPRYQGVIDQLHAIGRLDTPEAAQALRDLLPRLEGRLEDAAIHGIALCRAPEAREILHELAESDHPRQRRRAYRELAELDEVERAWLQKKRLRKERDPRLKAQLVELLVENGTPRMESAVLSAAKSKEKVLVAAGLRGIGVLKIKRGLKLVEKRTGDPDVFLRRRAFEALGAFGGRDAMLALLEAYGDARNIALRPRILDQLRKARTKEEVSALIRSGIGSRDEEVAAAALEALSFAARYQPDLCGPVLLDHLREDDPRMRSIAIEGLVRARPPGLIAALVERLGDRDPQTRADAAWALAQLGGLPTEAEGKMVELTRDPRASVRIQATLGLRWFPESDFAFQALLERFHDDLWSVRSAAVEASLAFRRRETLDALGALVATEKGRVRSDAIEALERMTGMDFGPLWRNWNRWLADLPPDWELPTEEEALATLEERRAKRTLTVEHTQAKSSEYHGIAVPTGGVVFILDVSGSMEMNRAPDGRTFFDFFSAALVETLDHLDPETDFGIVLFSDRAQVWREKLSPADEENEAAAKAFLLDSRPGGATNLYDALMTALDFPEVQTIFLMTDGEPTTGPVILTDLILADVTRLNRDRRIRIHTIAAGDANAEFLAELAAQNGGQAVDLTKLGKED